MKSIEKLSKVIEKLALIPEEHAQIRRECALLLSEFISDNTETKKNGALTVKDFVSKDELRPAMMHVFHDNDARAAVATDAHVLFANPDEYIEPTDEDTQKYDAVCGSNLSSTNYHGIVRNTYGVPQDGFIYPNWRSVIPSKGYAHLPIREDLQEVVKKVDSIKKINSIKKKDSDCMVNVSADKEHPVWINRDYIRHIVNAGIDGWECRDDRSWAAGIVKKWDGKVLLIMPMRPNDDFECGFPVDDEHVCPKEHRELGILFKNWKYLF